MPSTRTFSPSAFCPENNFFLTSAPSTATRLCVFSSSSVKKVPLSTSMRCIRDGAFLGGFGRDALQQRHLGLQVIEIVDREFDFAAGLGAARLQGGASGENEHQVRAPGAESDPEAALEAGAVGEQQYDGRDAPRHPKHGENAAAAVVLQRVVGLAYEFENHN